MAKHVILGKGNLGLDFELTARSMGDEVHLLTSSNGYRWPENKDHIKAKLDQVQPDYVWCTAGHGSVEQAKKDPHGAFELHCGLPTWLIKNLPEHVKIGLFSTDYVADEYDMADPNKQTVRPKSLYALSKKVMENIVKMVDRPNVAVFRVCSLYGSHLPDKCFPGKLKARYKQPCEVALPQNKVTPTPTWYVAELILNSLPLLFTVVGPLFHNCAAGGGTTVMNWGRVILGDDYTFESKGMDWERPAFSAIGCSFTHPADWLELWKKANQLAPSQPLADHVDEQSGSPSPLHPEHTQSQA